MEVNVFVLIIENTKPDAYPLLRIDDILNSFRSAKWFTTLDLASVYWQVEMHPDDIKKQHLLLPLDFMNF